MTESPFTMQLSVMLLLGTGSLVTLLLVGGVWNHLKGNPGLRRLCLGGAAGLLALYGILLCGVSLLSRPGRIAVGKEKYFCELDCHLAYRVAELHSLSRVASSPDRRLWAVTIRVRFDSTTISPRRSRTAPVWPAPRAVALGDLAGRRYPMRIDGSEVAALAQPLIPGQEISATLLFELPAGIEPTELLLTDDMLVSRFMVGHERSLLHPPVVLQLPHV